MTAMGWKEGKSFSCCVARAKSQSVDTLKGNSEHDKAAMLLYSQRKCPSGPVLFKKDLSAKQELILGLGHPSLTSSQTDKGVCKCV